MFGDDLRKNIIEGNTKNYNAIVAERNTDSINTLTEDNRKKLTQSQLTYWHPLNSLRGHNKRILMSDIPQYNHKEHVFDW